MKKEMKASLLATVLALTMMTGVAAAQIGNDVSPHQMRARMMNTNMADLSGPGMMDMHGRGMMGNGMMAGNMMMGPGMGRGMMVQGQAGCMNMMGGASFNFSAEDQQKFMDETKDLRRKMHDMRFDYMEAMRNPDTKLGDLADMEQKMLDVRKELLKKAEKYQVK